jgi:hypothetical protein
MIFLLFLLNWVTFTDNWKFHNKKFEQVLSLFFGSQFMLEKVGNTSIVLIRLGCEERKGPAYTIERLHVRGIKCPVET